MSKKNYVAVAEIVNEALRYHGETLAQNAQCQGAVKAALESVAGDLARYFSADNGRFDRGRFMRACGIN